MFERLLYVLLFAILGYWTWTAIRPDAGPGNAQSTARNALEMERCIKTKKKSLQMGGGISYEKQCAKELNLYLEAGEWHSRDKARTGSE